MKACLVWADAATDVPGPAPPPNILFVLCDDLGYGDVGVFYQNDRQALKDRSVPFFTTPHLDKLARDGIRMTQHYCAAPVCAPSRASLLTGRTQGIADVRDNQFDKALPDTHTLGTVLQEAGYATALIGKWGLQGSAASGKSPSPNRPASRKQADHAAWEGYPTRRGFDYYYGYVRHKDGHYHYPREDGREVWENDREVSEGLDLCFTTDLFTARAKQWIMNQQTGRPDEPFFLLLAFDTPHAVLINPPCAYPHGGGVEGGVQWLGTAGKMINTATGTMDGWMHPDYERATWDDDRNPETPEVPWPDVQKRYANNVRRIDGCVGDLMQLLDDLGIAENTLVVFTSDNGPSKESYLKEAYSPNFFRGFGPFDGIKRDTWEGGLRVPTVARWPHSIPAGREMTGPSGQWDWLATFAELSGVPRPAASDGVSLVSSLTGQGEPGPGTLYVEYKQNGHTPRYPEFAPVHRGRPRGQMQVIHLEGHKGIRYQVQSVEDDFEIYDLSRDPQETNNLATDEGLDGLQRRMKARVLQVRKPNPSAPRPYDSALVPPVPAEPLTPPGVSWAIYKGRWPWLPDYQTLAADATGEMDAIGLPETGDDEPFGMVLRGYFLAGKDGEYQFTLTTDTGAMLSLHDIPVIEEPRRGSAGVFSGRVSLKAGWHPLCVSYRHEGDRKQFELACTMASGERVGLDSSTLRRSEPR